MHTSRVDHGRRESADLCVNGFTGVLVIPPRIIACLPGSSSECKGKAIIAEVAVISDDE